MGPDFATNGEQTATKPFTVYGERAQLLKAMKWKDIQRMIIFVKHNARSNYLPSYFRRINCYFWRVAVARSSCRQRNWRSTSAIGAILVTEHLSPEQLSRKILLFGVQLSSEQFIAGVIVAGDIAIVTPYRPFVVGAIIDGAFIVGAIIAGAFIVGAVIAGANIAGAIMPEL